MGKGARNCGQDKNRREQKFFFHSFIIAARGNDFKTKKREKRRLAQTECFRNAGPRLRAAFFRVFFIAREEKKRGLPLASGIAKALDIVAPIAKARELRYSV